FLVIAVNDSGDLLVTLPDEDTTVDFSHRKTFLALANFHCDFLQYVFIEALVGDDVVFDPRQPAASDRFLESNVDNFRTEDVADVSFVSSVWSSCDTKFRTGEVVNDWTIRVCVSMVSFIHDDEV